MNNGLVSYIILPNYFKWGLTHEANKGGGGVPPSNYSIKKLPRFFLT